MSMMVMAESLTRSTPAKKPAIRSGVSPSMRVLCIASDQGMVSDEVRDLGHDLAGRWCLAHHGVADARQVLDEGWDAPTGVHEALVLIDDAPVMDQDSRDLGRPVPRSP
jgi:hypothetical protein